VSPAQLVWRAPRRQDRPEQERQPERLAQGWPVVGEQRREDGGQASCRDRRLPTGVAVADEGHEDDHPRAERDVEDLGDEDVGAEQPVGGAEQARVERRPEGGRLGTGSGNGKGWAKPLPAAMLEAMAW
jgi:hypothetical protein